MAFFHQPNYDAVIECLPTCAGATTRSEAAACRWPFSISRITMP
jgi:hypothetical protein